MAAFSRFASLIIQLKRLFSKKVDYASLLPLGPIALQQSENVETVLTEWTRPNQKLASSLEEFRDYLTLLRKLIFFENDHHFAKFLVENIWHTLFSESPNLRRYIIERVVTCPKSKVLTADVLTI